MFREHISHRNISLFDTVNQMSSRMRQRLESSWAEVFYREVFCKIDERLFEGFYSEKYSRPNTPVNILVSAELLKAYNRWSDAELFEQCAFNLQVRYALGEREFLGELFSERTLYYFRSALVDQMRRTGQNLLEQVFEQLTAEQLEKFEVKSGLQRTDSSFISSNIRTYSRIQLLIEVVQRFYRELTDEDKNRYAGQFGPYVQTTSGQYCYRLTTDNIAKRLSSLGELMSWILDRFRSEYGRTTGLSLIQRVFDEHFTIEDERVEIKPAELLSADSLQSPDDMEATFRRENDEDHHGYVFNVAETCEEANDVQLLTDVTVRPNTTDDTEIFSERLEQIAEKTDLRTILTDGGYANEDNDQLCERNNIDHIQSAIRGRKPSSEKLHLSDFTIEDDTIICPEGREGEIKHGRRPDRLIAYFSNDICSCCPLLKQCCTVKRKGVRTIYFTTAMRRRAYRRTRSESYFGNGKNPRASVERTVGLFKQGLPYGKLPVRGIYRVSHYICATAIMVNFGRIAAYYEQHAPFGDSHSFLLTVVWPYFLILLFILASYGVKLSRLKVKPTVRTSNHYI